MPALKLEKLPHPVKQVAASSLATVVLLVDGGLWLRGRFVDEMWEQLPLIEDGSLSIVQIAIRDWPTLEFPDYDILAVTFDGRLYEYANKRGGWERKWSAV